MRCQVEGIPVYYKTRGEGRPLLLLHGRPTDHHHMMHDVEPFFDHRTGWKRIYVDLPGMGRTPAADWITNEDGMLDAVLGFIDAVVGDERFVVAGTSYGGYLARGVAHRRAEQLDGLCLVVPAVVMHPEELDAPPPTTLVEDLSIKAELAPNEQWLYDWMVLPSRALLDTLRQVSIPAVEGADHAFLERFNEPGNAAFSFDVDRLPVPLAAPALFLTGRQDNAVGYRDAWALIEDYPRATFAVLDRAGHFLSDNQAVLFKALVNEWFDRVEEFAEKR